MSEILQVDHVNYHGRIAYLSKKPDRMDQERGRERFTITVHSDGHRTCTAQSEIDDRPERDAQRGADPGRELVSAGLFRAHLGGRPVHGQRLVPLRRRTKPSARPGRQWKAGFQPEDGPDRAARGRLSITPSSAIPGS